MLPTAYLQLYGTTYHYTFCKFNSDLISDQMFNHSFAYIRRATNADRYHFISFTLPDSTPMVSPVCLPPLIMETTGFSEFSRTSFQSSTSLHTPVSARSQPAVEESATGSSRYPVRMVSIVSNTTLFWCVQ